MQIIVDMLSSFLVFITSLLVSSDLGNESEDSLNRFSKWTQIAEGQNISPAWAYRNNPELTFEWEGPNNRIVQTTVLAPNLNLLSKEIEIPNLGDDIDYRPIFENIINRARKENIKTINLTANSIYKFKTIDPRYSAHLSLDYLKDFTVNGNGSTVIFENDATGLLVQQSKRLVIKDLTLKFSVRSSSKGQIVKQGSENVLKINEDNPVFSNDRIYQLAEVEPFKLTFPPNGARLIYQPSEQSPILYSPQTYKHKSFSSLTEGTTFAVLHRWYSGSAIRIDGRRNKDQTEDISLLNLRIHSTPGIGVAVSGLKRGLAIQNSSFEADLNDSTNFLGPSWDAIHINLAGGDILIVNNKFSHTGDDAININSPIHPIKYLNRATNKLTLSVAANFIAKDDEVAFFDKNGSFIALSRVINNPQEVKRGFYDIEVNDIPSIVDESFFIRDLNLIPSRYLIKDNLVHDTNGHGVLAQLPNGLIINNTFNRLCRNAIRLLTSVGQWNEGVGAFNVKVAKNKIIDGGTDYAMQLPWASISVYGGIKDGVSTTLLNADIEISDNYMSSIRQGCVSILNSENVNLLRNVCNTAGIYQLKPIAIQRSRNVSQE